MIFNFYISVRQENVGIKLVKEFMYLEKKLVCI